MENPLRVLHIDDDSVDQLTLRRFLRESTRGRFELSQTSSIAEAKSVLGTTSFDLIALDLSLPDAHGLESIESVLRIAPHTPIVVMTGHDDERLALSTIHHGAEDYLVKGSFGPQSLEACLLHAVERHRFRAQLEEAVARAEEASQAKSRFVASMSHEIRTPLNAILGMADLLAAGQLEPDQRQYVDIFRSSGRSLLFLLNNVLELSAIESGTAVLASVPFSPVDIARDSIETFAFLAHKKRIVIALDSEVREHLRVVGDPDRLRQILINLVGNAVKFTDEGEVVVRIRREAGEMPKRLWIEVEDTGSGIPEEGRARIFERFVRAPHGPRQKQGTGLGLALCSELVKRMDGEIEFESTVDVGSVFRVGLPLPIEVIASESDTKLAGHRVLLAQQATVERTILAAQLEAMGATVESCREAAELVRRLDERSSHSCVSVIADCRLEGGGIELAESISDHPGLTGRIVISLPMDHRRSDLERCRNIGAAAMLRPIRILDLCSTLAPSPASEIEQGRVDGGSPVLPKIRILLAEDSPENRVLIEAYLAKEACEIVVAEDGVQAVEIACSTLLDVILMDMDMPRKTGLEATSEIRAFERLYELRPTPIVALTAYSFAEQAAECLGAGCDLHLSKPIAKPDLVSALARYGRRDLRIAPDHELAELAGGYLDQRRCNLESIEQALAHDRFDQIRVLAHNMKGTGRGYGFPNVTVVGGLLEKAAIDRDAAEVQRLAIDLRAFLERAYTRTDS